MNNRFVLAVLASLLAACSSAPEGYEFDLARLRGEGPSLPADVTLYWTEFFDASLEPAAHAVACGLVERVGTIRGGDVPPGIVLVPDVQDVIRVPSVDGWLTSVYLEWRLYVDGRQVGSTKVEETAEGPRGGRFTDAQAAHEVTGEALERAFVRSSAVLRELLESRLVEGTLRGHGD